MLLILNFINTVGANNMEESYYQQELDSLTKVAQIVGKSGVLLSEKTSKYDVPEVLSSEELERRITTFQNSFYINSSKYKSFKSVDIKYTNFKTITNSSENMAVGFRWLEVMTTEKKNIINSESIVSKDDVSSFYVKQNNGATDHMSMFFGSGRDIKEEFAGSELEYVAGEAKLTFFPGHEKVELTKNDLKKTHNTESGVELTLAAFDKSYVSISFDYEKFKNFIIYGYNKAGEFINDAEMDTAYFYEEGKTAQDFTEATLPDEDGTQKAVFHAIFNGEVDKIELYFKKEQEERFVAVKAVNDPTVGMDIDDYSTVTEGPTNEVFPRANYQSTTIKDQIKETLVSFERSEALMSFNKPELTIHLSDIGNSEFARSYYSGLTLNQAPDTSYVPLEFYTRINGVIDSFKEKITDTNGNEDTKKAELIPVKTTVRGLVRVDYPTEIEWMDVKPGTSTLLDNHKVIVEGGLVSYYPPKGYALPDITWGVGGFIRAFDKEGRQLLYCTKTTDYAEGKVSLLKFGFWGTIHRIEIAVIKKWESYHQAFDAVVVPEMVNNKGAEDFIESVFGTMLGDEAVEKIKAEIAEEKANSGEEEIKDIPSSDYKVELLVDFGEMKEIPFTWHGVLPGGKAFSSEHTSHLLKEVINLSERVLHEIPSEDRTGELHINFYSLDKNGRVEKELSENQLLELLPKESKTDSLIELLDEKKIEWGTPKTEEEPAEISVKKLLELPSESRCEHLDMALIYYDDIEEKETVAKEITIYKGGNAYLLDPDNIENPREGSKKWMSPIKIFKCHS
jgi:hypothetical protein